MLARFLCQILLSPHSSARYFYFSLLRCPQLNLERNRISQIANLGGLLTLRILKLRGNSIAAIEGIDSLRALEHLDCALFCTWLLFLSFTTGFAAEFEWSRGSDFAVVFVALVPASLIANFELEFVRFFRS